MYVAIIIARFYTFIFEIQMRARATYFFTNNADSKMENPIMIIVAYNFYSLST